MRKYAIIDKMMLGQTYLPLREQHENFTAGGQRFMRNYNRKKHLSAGRGAGRRLAGLAGGVVMAFASPLSVWGAEDNKGGGHQ